MIQVKLSGRDVTFAVTIIGVAEFHFTYTAPTEWSAVLLHRTIVDQLGDRLFEIRKAAYEDGWRNGRKRGVRLEQKKTYFERWFK